MLNNLNCVYLQITELLKEVSLKQKRISEIHHLIENLKDILLQLPRGKEHDVIFNIILYISCITNATQGQPLLQQSQSTFLH